MRGKYRLLAELGQGGTANVYLAVARGPSGFNKLVVLKSLRTELAGESEFRRMFLNEARLAARLNHPNVVQTYEVFEEGGRPTIVMEYLEGAPLSRVVARSREQGQPITLPMHLRIICEALSGLHYSHELRDYDGTPLGVVHRDMTPQNLFVSFSGKISLLDFGIAKLTGSIAETQTGILKGKLRYMPPEQILGEIVDRRTDIFAVGVMLWEAVAREKMWRGLNDATIMYNIVNGVLPSPRTVRDDLPEELERICMKALASDPNGRYATAAELQAELEQWLDSHAISNRTIGQFVNSVFRDERAKTRELIERQIAVVESDADAVIGNTSLMNLAPSTYTSAYPSDSSTMADAPSPRRSRAVWIALPLLLLVGVILGRSVWKQPSTAMPQGAEPAVEAKAAPAPAPRAGAPAGEEQHIAVKVSAWPPKARIYLDDQPLAANPFSATVPADHAEHSIRAEAPGYTAEKKIVTFDKDVDLALRLGAGVAPAVGGPAPKLPVRAQAPGRPTPEAETAPTSDSKSYCDPPYYIDENGIRRLKAKCLSGD